MFECQICGLLSLGGTACPACGSQLRTDLTKENLGDEVLPTEVPGLDDAAAAWYDLEGMEPPADEPDEMPSSPSAQASSLPFGFQGESNVYDSRLPFGIGSFATGIPFDASNAAQPSVSEESGESQDASVSPSSAEPSTVPATMESAEAAQPEEERLPVVPEPVGMVPEPAVLTSDRTPPQDAPESDALPSAPSLEVLEPAEPVEMPDIPEVAVEPVAAPVAPPPPEAPAFSAEPVRLTSVRLVTQSPEQAELAVPDYWKIDAQIPDYEQIYGQDETVVEMEYASLDEDVVVYDHTSDSPAAVFYSPLEATPASTPHPSVKLQLHPVQAMRVDVGQSVEMQTALQTGFAALQSNDWSGAARAFQKMAAGMPTNAEVYNNYGISLLQRATAMRDGNDPQQQSVAETQFESSILALREAAKNAPTNGDVLINLAIALIESGRSEKALGIMNVHNARSPGSAKGLNTAAVAMFELGQLTQAVDTLSTAGDDATVVKNLNQLSPNTRQS